MALITVMSAKGAPGATTTAMLISSLWPQPTLLVDADPNGGDVALRLGREDGRPMDRERGLLSLLPAARRGLLPSMVNDHAQTALGGQQIVAGLAGPGQSNAVTPLWPALADAFAEIPETDVVVDVGQVHERSSHLSIVERSDLMLWVFRPNPWSAIHTRRRLEGLSGFLAEAPIRVGVVAVAGHHEEDDAVSAAEAIIGDWEWVTSYGSVAWDRQAVVMFEGGEVRRPERTLLARSGRSVAQRLHDDLPRRATVAASAPEVRATEAETSEAEAGSESSRLVPRRRAARRKTRRKEQTE